MGTHRPGDHRLQLGIQTLTISMTTEQAACPICGKTDDVTKVSTLYLTGIGLRKVQGYEAGLAGQTQTSPNVAARASLSARAQSRRFAPPSSGRQMPTRPIHPDLVIIAFSAVSPFFLYGILTSQTALLLPVLILLAVFYVFYFWQRKKIIAKFQKEQAARQAAIDRIQRGINRWMKLYYCAREDGVFEPGSNQVVPLDQMPGYLLREE